MKRTSRRIAPVALFRRQAHGRGMVRKSPLEDSSTADFAWARWRKMLALMAAVTALTVGAAFAWFATGDEPVSVHFYIATALGIGVMMLLTGALMGLVFLSNGTGHDDAVGEDRGREP